MIWLDVTKSARARHRSGLTRVTNRLAEELGAAATPVGNIEAGPRRFRATDCYLTAEVFAPDERPGMAEFLTDRPCKLAAIYHDSIPLRFPHITWPQAVARHPAYLTMLSRFDRVWAVSAASRDELLGFWKWQGRTGGPEVSVLQLGSDLRSGALPALRSPVPDRSRSALGAPLLLCVGIIEPRKNQLFLLEVCDRLWAEGLRFDLHFVGRVNPHFGRPIVREIRAMQRKCPSLFYDGAVDDQRLSELYSSAAACVFPTLAEGCGLPLLEALWHGTPCISSDLPSLLENAAGGGCLTLPTGSAEAWTVTLRKFLTEPADRETLTRAAGRRAPGLPTWKQTAEAIKTRSA